MSSIGGALKIIIQMNNTMWDMDGAICKDPKAYDDDGAEYECDIRTAKLLNTPKEPIIVCTNRIERWRGITLEWLSRHKVRVKSLIMQPYATANERRRFSLPAKFKAKNYETSGCDLFVESHKHIAKQIVTLTDKPVYCIENGRYY